jgi:hypothetical protein
LGGFRPAPAGVGLAAHHHGPDDAGHLVGQRDRRQLLRLGAPARPKAIARCVPAWRLIIVMALSVVSLVGVAAMLNHPPGRPRWEVNLHMAVSLLAVILSWFLAHIYFGLYYMQLYYDDTVVDGKLTYHLGLEFPERLTADFWDFMYYSFTIAMCYQTSDVTVTSTRIRRVTLMHAIFSFSLLRRSSVLWSTSSRMLHERSRTVIAASAALIVIVVTASSGSAQLESQPDDTVAGPPAPRTKHKPIDLDIEARPSTSSRMSPSSSTISTTTTAGSREN